MTKKIIITEDMAKIVEEFLQDIEPVDLDNVFSDSDFNKIKLIIKYELERWERILLALDCMNYSSRDITQLTGVSHVTVWTYLTKIKEKIIFFDENFTYESYLNKIKHK